MMKPEKKNAFFAVLFGVFILSIVVIHTLGLEVSDLYFDESNHALSAGLFVSEGIPVYETNILRPPLYDYFASFAYSVFGINNFGLRFFSMVAGFFSIWLVYRLSKLYFNRKVAVLAALLLAVNPLYVMYGRIGIGDVMFTMFGLAGIYFTEIYWRNPRFLFLLLASIAFSLSFLTKFSAFMLFGFYWLFLFSKVLLAKDWTLFKKYFVGATISSLLAAFFAFLFVVLTGGMGRVLQLVHNFIVQYTIQAVSVEYSRFYHFGTFFDWLSPLVYGVLILSAALFLFNYGKHHESALIWWMGLGYLVLLTVLPRKAINHFVPIIPFMMVAAAWGLYELRKHRMVKPVWAIFVGLVLVSSLGWSVSAVYQMQSYTFLGDTAEFINENYPNNTVNVHLRDYPQISMATDNEVIHVDYLDFAYVELKERSLVLIPSVNSSFDDHVLVSNKFSPEYSSADFRDYFDNNGIKLYTASYLGQPVADLYEVIFVDPNLVTGLIKPPTSLIEPSSVRGLWVMLCKAYKFNPSVIQKIFPSDLAGSVKNRCSV